MYLCYLDEAGCTGVLPSPTSDIQPVFALAAILVRQDRLAGLTHDFLDLKRKFFPGETTQGARPLDAVLLEIKGSQLRHAVCAAGRNRRRHALGFLDKTVRLLEQNEIKILGRVLVKGINIPIDGKALYTASVQSLCAHTQAFLETVSDSGMMIADHRSKAKNANLSHSIFTQKFSKSGDRYSRLLEMPSYGHSENHVGLQLADLLCSAFLVPFAIHGYCEGRVTSVHVRPEYNTLRQLFASRLKNLQFRHPDSRGKLRGSVVVDDKLTQSRDYRLF